PCTVQDVCAAGECRGRRVCDVDVNLERNVAGTLKFLVVDCGVASDEPIQRASCQATGTVAVATAGAIRSAGAKGLDPSDVARRGVTKSKRVKLTERRPRIVLKLRLNKLGARLLKNGTSPFDVLVRTTIEQSGTRTEVEKLVRLLGR